MKIKLINTYLILFVDSVVNVRSVKSPCSGKQSQLNGELL